MLGGNVIFTPTNITVNCAFTHLGFKVKVVLRVLVNFLIVFMPVLFYLWSLVAMFMILLIEFMCQSCTQLHDEHHKNGRTLSGLLQDISSFVRKKSREISVMTVGFRKGFEQRNYITAISALSICKPALYIVAVVLIRDPCNYSSIFR